MRGVINKSDREASCLSEGKFASIFAQCPDAMLIVSLADGHIMDANEAFVERTGIPLDEVIGKTPTELNLWAVPGIGPKVLLQLQTGDIHNLEIPFRRKNGETFSGLMSAQPFEHSPIPAVLVIVRDITQLKQARQQLQLSEEKFAKAFHASPDGMAITRQQDGMLLEVNEGFCRLTGYSEKYCLDHSTFDLGIWVDLSERSRLIEQMKQHGFVRDLRVRIRNSNGDVRLCELSSQPVIIAGEDCLLTTTRDITESRQMQEKLHLAATVFESTAEGVLITNTDQTISAVNRAFTEITGYSESEAIGKTPRLLASGQHDSAFYAAMWHQLAAEGHWQGEISNRRKNGELYPSWLTISAVRNKDNVLTHFVAVFADISSLKHAQARLDYQAHHDPLTGLPNRTLFENRLQAALLHSEESGSLGAVLFLDLGRFKHINDSLGQLRQTNLLERIEQLLTDNGLEPGCLQLEITENFIMSQTQEALAVLHQLKTLGVQLAIDDFGTGYSSLSYLKRLPLDILKIDQSFVRGLPEDTHDAAIVRAIIALGRSLQLTVIAEGVENSEQQQFLTSEGCEQIQGYIVSLPLDAEEFCARFLLMNLSDFSDSTAAKPPL